MFQLSGFDCIVIILMIVVALFTVVIVITLLVISIFPSLRTVPSICI